MKAKGKEQAHTTNYLDTFIEVAEDCRALSGQVPQRRNGKKTIAAIQFEMLSGRPYQLTSDDVIFQTHAEKKDLIESEYASARTQFFAKGQPCLRTSPLTKQLGWGVHCDSSGRVALYGRETEAYERFLRDTKITKVKAMRTSKNKG